MIKGGKNTSPRRRKKEFCLFGNILEAKIPEYNSMRDKHMQGYFKKKMTKAINKQYAIVNKIYNSNKELENLKTREKVFKLPILAKSELKKKISPITSDQLKKIISKFRLDSENSRQSASLTSERNIEI